MVTIKFADIRDAELIAALSQQTFIETFDSMNTKENMDMFLQESFSKELLIKEVVAPGNIFLLAYENEMPVGYVRLRDNNNPPELAGTNSMEIARIYAIKNAIGKGVGKLLMQECISIAEQKNKSVIWLGVWEHNKRAIDFYTKWGFEKFSTHNFKLGDDNQTDWLMKKILI
ncbi:MAG: GNAT family N-acetyltransferase [Chitinophagaceae bacterium]